MMVNPEIVALISQQHEAWLNELEGLAIEAIATNNWSHLYDLIADFQVELTIDALKDAVAARRANTEDLDRPGAGFVPTTQHD
jgi:hypothetical protein